MAEPLIPTSIIKDLVSSNPRTRTSALDEVRLLISTPNRSFSTTTLLGPWKALYYTMWHADRPITQQRLAADLASLTFSVAKVNVLAWLEAFWRTIAREWKGVDALRLDKFLLLVRRYLGAGFEWCRQAGWGEAEVDGVLGVLETVPLCVGGGRVAVPDGLRYHVLDIYVDELERIGDVERMPVEVLLGPVRALGEAKGTQKVMRKRVGECLGDERLVEWRKEGGEGGDDSKESGNNSKESGNEGEAVKSRDEDEDDEFSGFDE